MGYLWKPPRDLISNANVYKFMEEHGFKSYRDLVEKSRQDIEWFWGNLPRWLGVEWFEEPKSVVDTSQGIEWAKWYRGGSINLAYNVLDRHVKNGMAGKEAFTWVGEDGSKKTLSYGDLQHIVDGFARFLLDNGIRPGDVISIYAPMMPESIAAMLAAIKIGAIASPIFSGFAPGAVAERLKLAESRIMVTVDGFYRRGRKILLKPNADEAAELAGTVDRMVVIERLKTEIPWNDGRDVKWSDATRSQGPVEPYQADPEHPALLLFTSGTTGSPKGAVISHAGALLQPAKEHYFNLDIKPGSNDRLWWITDIGWMMGPWQVIGSQFLGASHFMIEGAIEYPERDRVWKLIDEYRVTHFGFAATVARILKKLDPNPRETHSLESIRAFGNTGEPIDEDTWLWIVRNVGEEKRPMINLSGGTEIFGCFLLPSPIVELKPSTLWGPGLGMDVDVFDDNGKPVRGQPGYLVAKKPAPSMTRGLWRDPDRYIKTYWSRFPGVWYHGDLALIDEAGFWFILGRADDLIKVAGKRIGPAEIETIINSHPAIAESACIGWPHKVKGEVIVCFATMKPGHQPSSELEEELKNMVAERIGKPFRPEAIEFVEDLPRTRSGKIMRRIIRALMHGHSLGQLAVLENPESIEGLKPSIDRVKKRLS